MGKILVLAEKPSVGRELAKVLGCSQNSNGYISGSKYIVTWSLGHLVTLADPEAYGEKYKSWRIEDLPMLPNKMELVVIKETSKQYGIVKSLLNRADVDELVIATDSGREGELVARWIIIKAGFRKPIKRLWISSQTEKAIKDGFNNLRPSREYDNLYKSAECRSEADWLIGLNVTRALTCKYNAQLSAGRVQTPTLAMIVQRETDIRRFLPKDFWTISAKVKGFSIQWQDKASGQTQIFNKQQAEDILAKIKGQNGEVIEIKKEAKEEQPPLAYDLTELQRDANRKYSYSAKQTLGIMQSLYETHKIVTYPRTDSRHITTDIVPTLSDRLKSISVGPYAEAARALLRAKLYVTKRFVDNSKVTDHHAIIPTEQYLNLGSLSNEERNIFDLIVKRFIAILSPAFTYEQTTVKISVKGEIFFAKGRIIKSKGWKAVYEGPRDKIEDSDEEQDQSLPEIKRGESMKLDSSSIYNGKTKPPARYNEATLLTAMEHPGKFIENEALREAMDKTSGLGTPATRADIIEKLFSSFYAERRGKEIHPTSKGIQLVDLVPVDLKSPELTAKWEQKLTMIKNGRINSVEFINEMKAYASKIVSSVIASTAAYKHDNMTREKCPDCGKFLLDVSGKKGKMLVCSDRECGYRKGVSQVSNARCPDCHKKMEIRGDGDNKSFYCGCGYREKLEAFTKRKGEQVNKKEVSNFLNQQDEGEPINSALAEALAKWGK
ncbi:MAG TPA: DNA topoisomerase III [Ruminiclostridium sp.]